MALTPTQKSDFISRYRAALTASMDADDQLRALKSMWDGLGLSGTLVDGDFTGANAGLTAADLQNAVAVYAGSVAPVFQTTGFPTTLNKIRNI